MDILDDRLFAWQSVIKQLIRYFEIRADVHLKQGLAFLQCAKEIKSDPFNEDSGIQVYTISKVFGFIYRNCYVQCMIMIVQLQLNQKKWLKQFKIKSLQF